MRVRMGMQGLAVCLAALLWVCAAGASDEAPLLVQTPTVSKTSIVFAYGGMLWSVAREGGDARQLTTGGHERLPVFSPDGRWIAFSGEYDGNTDVYVMPAEGGEPRRLTWHPAADLVTGWTPDSKRVLFRSEREAYADFSRLYTVAVGGGVPEALPMWRGEEAWYSPDGTRLAYVPNMQWQRAWKRYRGGQTTPVQIVRLADLTLERIPRANSNDNHPVWMGETVYFLSDRNGPVSLFGYNTKSKEVKQLIVNNGYDFKSLSAGPDALVYEQFGGIHLYDPASGKSRKVLIRVSGDLPATRAHYRKVGEKIAAAGISPAGARAVFEANGEILTAPAEKGDVRNLTRTPGVAERDPAWSPDGKWIAYFSDESGEYALHLADPAGKAPARKIELGRPPSFFYSPLWSPDSKRIAIEDKRLNLWIVDVEKGSLSKADADRYEEPENGLNPAWSPDSKWLAYTKLGKNHLRAVYVYSLESGKSAQVTEGLSDARYAVFDKGGKYLFFTASTDVGLSAGWLDLSSFQHPVSRNVYAVVLKKGEASPVEPQSDEEKAKAAEKKEEKKDEKAEEPVKVVVDLEGIGQRIVALPVRAANYTGLEAGKAGILFLGEAPAVPSLESMGGPANITISKFDLSTRKTEPFLSGVAAFHVSANGEKALYRQGKGWFIAGTAAAPKTGEGALNVAEMEVYADPRAEWSQMYHEAWRIQRDFLYDPNHHGLNLISAEKKYAPFLTGAGGRADINYLFEEMLGEITVGHMFIGGGEMPDGKKVKGGLLGADYRVENGRFRFARIYNGENWNPDLRAPLTQPGVDVRTGDYLLEVNGVDALPAAEVQRYFENTAGKQTRIKVAATADGKDAREVSVVPVEDEFGLRNRAWEEDNRRKVEEMS